MKIGIALSGGGGRGITHLGVLKALQEADIKIDLISGVSAGGIVGAFISAGYSPEEVVDIILKTSLFKFLRPGFRTTGLLKLEYAESLFKQFFKDNSFEKLKIPLIISALNLRTGKIDYFSEGDLILPLLASASIPIIFNPITINSEQYVDGGLIENLPVSPLVNKCDFIIGSHCNPVNEDYRKITIRTYIERIFLLTINNNAKHSMEKVDFSIEPDKMKHIRWSDYKKVKEIYNIGYEHTLSIIPQLKEKLYLKSS